MKALIDDDIYKEICTLIYTRAGITLGEGKVELVYARLGKRLRTLGLSDHREYVEYLHRDKTGDELVKLLDAISTNFTSFWREPTHFEFLGHEVEKWIAAGQRRIRIWCAAASTGEEPYTLAMVCLNAARDQGLDLRILCTDISTRVLGICNEGIYTGDKMTALPLGWRERFFEPVPGEYGSWRAGSELRSHLTFSRLNLMETPYPMSGPFDVIFCRNVMIYFDTDGRKKVVGQALRLLKPGGLFFTGHSESLNGITGPLKLIRPSVYQIDKVK